MYVRKNLKKVGYSGLRLGLGIQVRSCSRLCLKPLRSTSWKTKFWTLNLRNQQFQTQTPEYQKADPEP